jgi:hypothetical protein
MGLVAIRRVAPGVAWAFVVPPAVPGRRGPRWAMPLRPRRRAMAPGRRMAPALAMAVAVPRRGRGGGGQDGEKQGGGGYQAAHGVLLPTRTGNRARTAPQRRRRGIAGAVGDAMCRGAGQGRWANAGTGPLPGRPSRRRCAAHATAVS